MKICGLIGSNIQYSKSPDLHNEYYKDNNIPFEYKLFDIKEDELGEFVSKLHENNIIGFNVTIPYKEKILSHLHRLEYPANLIGAVNTVLLKEDTLIGYNTDYFGFIESLNLHKIEVKGKSVLIIGNGGSAKAVYYALKDLGALSIDVAGRNIQKIEREFFFANNILNIKTINSLYKYDLIVNCTPLGNINNNIMPVELLNFNKNLIIYDLNYIPKESKILIEGKKKGLRTINGESMLKAQAYCAIKIWTANAQE